MPIHDAAKLLESTPELFIKLPGRGDGITRYRLASSVAARSDKQIADLLHRQVRRESGIFYALAANGAPDARRGRHDHHSVALVGATLVVARLVVARSSRPRGRPPL